MNTELRACTEEDFEFAFEAKRQAMGPYIAVKWEWDEECQRSIHEQRWKEKPWFLITLDTVPVGTVSIHHLDRDLVRFGEFYLLKKFQGQGIGTELLKSFLKECDRDRRRVRLECLKWNPVGSLYKRNGFRVVSENEIHYFLEREPNAY
jgi:RimJ/RimL family protein N-acetyltransferase